jgi:hypothetical protein
MLCSDLHQEIDRGRGITRSGGGISLIDQRFLDLIARG